MSDRQKDIKELDSEIKKYKASIKTLETALKDPKIKGREELLSKVQGLNKQLKLAETILQKLKKAPPGDFEDLKAVTSAIFGNFKQSMHEHSNPFTMDKVNHAKDHVKDFSNEKVHKVKECIKEKPLLSAACALGVGFIIGALINRSK